MARRRKYRNHFLKQVIVRADFPHPLPLEAEGIPPSVSRQVKKRFPSLESRNKTHRTVHIHADADPHTTTFDETEWWFWNKSRTKHLVISPTSCVADYSKYSSFDVLMKDYIPVLRWLRDAYPDLQVSRLGLRYIDDIRPDDNTRPTDWSRYLNKRLLQVFSLADEPRTITRALNFLEMSYGDMSLRFQFGMPNPDYPATIRKKSFILDFDAYTTDLVEVEEIAEKLDRFHSKIGTSFEEVITDHLRKLMEPRP